MIISSDALDTQIPYYLTEEQKSGLKKAFSDFSNAKPIDYYIDKYPDELLQGDGWHGLELLQFDSGERRAIKGIVLSNTCDVSPENKRDLPSKIVFAPIVKLANYEAALIQAGLAQQQIAGKLQSIREQLVTTMFYLPACGKLDGEYIAMLDDIHTLPASAFLANGAREKLFTLSMVGFYLFVFKLSIHFCRFHEEVAR